MENTIFKVSILEDENTRLLISTDSYTVSMDTNEELNGVSLEERSAMASTVETLLNSHLSHLHRFNQARCKSIIEMLAEDHADGTTPVTTLTRRLGGMDTVGDVDTTLWYVEETGYLDGSNLYVEGENGLIDLSLTDASPYMVWRVRYDGLSDDEKATMYATGDALENHYKVPVNITLNYASTTDYVATLPVIDLYLVDVDTGKTVNAFTVVAKNRYGILDAHGKHLLEKGKLNHLDYFTALRLDGKKGRILSSGDIVVEGTGELVEATNPEHVVYALGVAEKDRSVVLDECPEVVFKLLTDETDGKMVWLFGYGTVQKTGNIIALGTVE